VEGVDDPARCWKYQASSGLPALSKELVVAWRGIAKVKEPVTSTSGTRWK
jgi:hypothetical protein